MRVRFCAVCTVLCAISGALFVSSAPSQQPVARLHGVPSSGEARVALRQPAAAHARGAETLGKVPANTALPGLSLVLKPSDAQDAALTQLLADQQNPASASYRQWLTPEQFGQRFGAADADITLIERWLQSNGFTVESVPASRNRIVFSGNATLVDDAFHTGLRRYRRNGRDFFENSDAVQLPASLVSVVSSVTGLSSFRLPAPQSKRALAQVTASPDYTTSTGSHYLVPDDLRTIYGTNTLIGSGYNGSGIKIGIIGQSAVDTTQLTYFQQKTGQTLNLPTMVLVPNTGVSNKVDGDEGESELDLEYAGGNAPGASVQFIYTGCTSTTSSGVLSSSVNCNNNGVFDALTYAVTFNLAPILSLSYGGCEEEDAAYANSTLEPVLRQANAQGQTIMVSSGDAGAASCESNSATKVATAGLAVSYPASSPYVTGVGGTTLPKTDDTGTYWTLTNNTYLGSATGYMPETAWNDTLDYGSLSSSGGGASKIFGKPSWQAGTGVPADGHRDVPDVAFPANVTEHAYLTCDASGPCTSGNKSFTLGGTVRDGGGVGGTSAAAPSFAGMLAIVEQANGGKALGNLNPSLYALAAGSSATSIFHDITTGSNIVSCTTGTADCTTGSLGYSATAGYDLVTGLGSIAIPALRTGLQTATVSSSNTATVSLAAGTTTPLINSSITFTASAVGSGTTPTGTMKFAVDGGAATSVALTSGVASYTLGTGFATAGAHTVVATYSGDGTYSAASASLSVTASAGSGSIGMTSSPSTLTISAGSSGTEAITLTSSGFSGILSFRAALLSSTTSTFPYCLSLSPGTVNLQANTTQTTTLTVNTAASCSTKSGAITVSGTSAAGSTAAASNTVGTAQRLTWGTGLLALSFCIAGCLARRRPVGSLLGLLSVSCLGLALAGCGSGGTATTSTSTSTGTGTTTTTTGTNSTATTGSYSLRITAVAATNTSITANTTFSLVVK